MIYASGFRGFRDRGVDPRDGCRTALLHEDQLAAQTLRPLREPLVEQLLQLRVQRDIAVSVQLAQRDVQPVGRTDLNDGIGGQCQVLALAHAGPSEELDGQPHEGVVVGAGGLQQLGRRCVVEEPGQGFVGDRHVGGQDWDLSRRVRDLPFQQPDKEATQRAEPVLDRMPMQRPAPLGRPLSQPALVVLHVRSAQVGDALRERVALGDESGELPQRRLDVLDPPRPQCRRHLLQVGVHGGAHPLGHLGPLLRADVGFGAGALAR